MQRYGLWDHKGPLEEQIPSPESCEGETKAGEGDEAGGKAAGGEDEEIAEVDNLKKVG